MIVLKRLTTPQPTVSRCYELAGTLSGTLNGTNQTFYTEYDYLPGTISVFYNGQALYSPEDFTESGDNKITFIYLKPYEDPEGTVLRASYELLDCSGEISSSTSKKGMYNIPHLSAQASVTFSEAFSNTNYVITTNLVNTQDVQPSVYPYIVGQKRIDGFIVYFQDSIDSGNYVLEWIAMAL